MPTQVNWKIVVVAGLLAAAIVGQSMSWYGIAILVLGVFNTVVTVPGTFGVRVVAIIAAAITLLRVVDPEALIVFAVWIWPPAFLVGWAIARRRDGAEEIDDALATPWLLRSRPSPVPCCSTRRSRAESRCRRRCSSSASRP
jgi:hypothetical protein